MQVDGRTDFFSPKRYLAEFIASLAITYVTTLTSIFNSQGKSLDSAIFINSGIAITVWAWLLRSRTGGVLNPAMAIALGKVGQLPWFCAITYAIIQILGGAFAAGLIYVNLPADITTDIKLSGNGLPLVTDVRYLANALVTELIATMFMSFIVIGLITDKRCTPEVYAIGYGAMTIVSTTGFFFLGGGTCNPARVIGPSTVLGPSGGGKMIAPVVGQFIGAFIGGMLYDEVFKRAADTKDDGVKAAFESGDGGEGTELMTSGRGILLSGGVDMEVNAGLNVNVDVDVDMDVEVEIDAGVELEVELEVGLPEVELEVDLGAGVEIEGGLEVELEVPEVDVELEVEVEVPEVEVELEVEVPEVEAELEVEVEVEAEIEG